MDFKDCVRNNLEINSFIRIVKISHSFSFSLVAANSMAVATFVYFNFKDKIKFFGFLFLWPLIFAYSIYLGLHYPVDILTGYLFDLPWFLDV
jgi:undecaprenyl-diphosphatase